MVERNYILATAGHVDHGKSALVRELTGIDPDRLPEEKARGITIDLGFAHLDLPVPGRAGALWRLGLVDVPGHEDFVRNMVAGVGSVDLALLVVAADDGWMPQTEEHLQILAYLGVTRALVALTKVDLVEEENRLISAVRERLKGSPFDASPIVPTSVVTRRGLVEVKQALADILQSTPPARDIGKPRLAVDRVFTMRGAGTVVTGTLSGGGLAVGQPVVVQPSGVTGRIRGLQSHNQVLSRAGPGMRVALNLADVGTDELQRGDVVTLRGLGSAGRRVDVVLEKTARLLPASNGPGRTLRDGTRVRIHVGSGNVAGTVRLLGAPLTPGNRVLARLTLEEDLFVFMGDRFVLRDWSEQLTLAGGVVLDPLGQGHPWRDAGRGDRLHRRLAGLGEAEVMVVTELAERGAVPDLGCFVQSRFSAEEIVSAVGALVRSGQVVAAGVGLVDASVWAGWLSQAAEMIRARHRAFPEEPGLPLVDLQAGLRPGSAAWFESLIEELTERGFVRSGRMIRDARHRPSLPPRLQAAGERLRSALSAKPLEPPSCTEWIRDKSTSAALQYLVQTGEAVELAGDVLMSAEGYARAVAGVRTHLRHHGRGTVSELRQALGTTRRIMVPLLEKLDREGITRREGDTRVLGSLHE